MVYPVNNVLGGQTMKPADHDLFMQAWRKVRDINGSKISQAEYTLIMKAINGTWRADPAPPGGSALNVPAWVAAGKERLGQREVVGPKHNNWISAGWAKLGATWFNDDETPWCGFFVAYCMDAVGLPYPAKGMFARAKEWLNWGKPCPPVLGAVVVYSRQGGGHVGILVGESATHYYVLGGNQDNCVSIAPFHKMNRKPEGFRWPASLPLGSTALPRMTGGASTKSEA